MEEDFLLILKKNKDLVALVGNRISIDDRPSGPEPAIVVSRVSGGHEHQLSGSVGFARPVLHVMCFASRATTANHLKETARKALQGFSGVVGRTNFGSLVLDDEDHDYEPPLDAGDLTGTFSRLLVFTVLHGEQIPTFS